MTFSLAWAIPAYIVAALVTFRFLYWRTINAMYRSWNNCDECPDTLKAYKEGRASAPRCEIHDRWYAEGGTAAWCVVGAIVWPVVIASLIVYWSFYVTIVGGKWVLQRVMFPKGVRTRHRTAWELEFNEAEIERRQREIEAKSRALADD